MGSMAGQRSLANDTTSSGRLQIRIARPGRGGTIAPTLGDSDQIPLLRSSESGRRWFFWGGVRRNRWVSLLRKGLLFALATFVVGGSLIASPWLVGKTLQLVDNMMDVKSEVGEHDWLLTRRREEGDGGVTRKDSEIWAPPPDNGWRPCLDGNASLPETVAATPSGYYQVFCNGGLNQLHICICNSVVVAKLLGATLVLPWLEVSPVWKDPSGFGEIFDLPYFLAELEGHVSIVTELPPELHWSTWQHYFGRRGGCFTRPNCVPNAPKHATPEWYAENILPRIAKFGVAVNTPTTHRLTFDDLPPDATSLRCWTALRALRFAPPIRLLASILVQRLRKRAYDLSVGVGGSAESAAVPPRRLQLAGDADMAVPAGHGGGRGRYLALHLRFEIDMLAHSKCDYGRGLYQKWTLKSMRQRLWHGHVPNAMRANGTSAAQQLRLNGKCPLNPDEVALLLAALGYPNSTTLFVAAHSVFGGEEKMRVLRELFPHIETKHTLATAEEVQPFLGATNKLAAIDQLIALESDVFVSNAAGNLPNVISGLRTFRSPPLRSIHVDKANVTRALLDKSLTWEEFSTRMIFVHTERQGSPVARLPKHSMYRYPAPDCMCKSPSRTL